MSKKTVLVIDDEEGIRDTLRFALELEGWEVHTAKNGKEGLKAIQETPRIDLIFVDLMMPIMNGWEFIAATKNDPSLSSIPIVIVTAFPEIATRFPDKAPGLTQYPVLSKPFNLDAVIAVLTKCGSR
jgi:CheY-like chemotaxis protein